MIAKYRRTHKQVQVEKTIARSGGMLKLVPPFLKISLVLTIVKPVDVDVVAVGCFKVFRLFKVAFLDPAGLGDGVESIVVCGEQNCVNLIQDAVRDLKPEEGVLGLSEELMGWSREVRIQDDTQCSYLVSLAQSPFNVPFVG